jgi:Uma2 family endonuclease
VFSEAGIALPDRNDSFYVADLAIIREPLWAEDRLIRNPVLLVEVLSPITAAMDRQIKVPDYRRISSVMEILLIALECAFAEVHRREGARWITEIMRELDATLALNSVPLTILLSELYEGIPLPDRLATTLGMSV